MLSLERGEAGGGWRVEGETVTVEVDGAEGILSDLKKGRCDFPLKFVFEVINHTVGTHLQCTIKMYS